MMKKQTLLPFVLAFLMLLASACSASPSGTPDPEVVATLSAQMFQTEQARLAQEASKTPQPESTEPPETTSHPLAGVVYLSNDILWLIDQDGQPLAILQHASYASPSTDGRYVLYEAGEPADIYIKDLQSDQVRQLTDTPDIAESSPRFVPGQDWVVYHYMPADEMGISAGYLGAVNPTTGETQILDGQNGSSSIGAISPDGSKIAYGGGTAWTYSWSSGPQKLEPLSYGLNLYDIIFDSSSWSPDGRQLAWSIKGEFSGQGDIRAGVVIFDLPNHTYRMIHDYALSAGGGFSNFITWSPDGAWLACVLHYTVPNQRSSSLWLLPTQDEQQHTVDYASNPVWSPDGAHLIFIQWPDPSQGNFTAQDASLRLMQTGTWATELLSLPPGSQVLDWIQLP